MCNIRWEAAARGFRPRLGALLAALAVLAPVLVRADRPLTIDVAVPVAPGEFEFEAGVLYEGNGSVRHYEVPFALTHGLMPTLALGLGFGGQLEEREELQNAWDTEAGLGDLRLGAKWNPLPEQDYWASHALAFTAKLPTASHHNDFGSGKTDFDLTYIASKTLTDQLSAHFNAGYTWTGNPDGENLDDIFHGGVAAGWRASARIELVAELFTDVPLNNESDASLMLSGGLRWSATDRLVFDAAVATGLRGDAPDWLATVGLTWTFGFKRKPPSQEPKPAP